MRAQKGMDASKHPLFSQGVTYRHSWDHCHYLPPTTEARTSPQGRGDNLQSKKC